MKKRVLLITAAAVLFAAGCITVSAKKGNQIFNGMTLDDSALIFCSEEEGTSYQVSVMYQHDDLKSEFLKALSTVKAEEAENWSFDDLTYPIYGFSLMNAERFTTSFAWSNGFLFTQDGKKYKFDYNFEEILTGYPFDESWENGNPAQFPCARQYMLQDGVWNTDFMGVGQEPENKYDVDYEVTGIDGDKLTVRFTNHMDENYFFGEYYMLQVLVGGTWYSVPPAEDMMFHDLGYELAPDQSYDMTYWIGPYGDLPAGHYRVLNSIGTPTCDFAAEFDLP